MMLLLTIMLFMLSMLANGWLLAAPAAEKKVYMTRHINPHPPAIDGKPGDVVWKKVPWEGNFIQRQPNEGDKPSQDTAFKVLFDEKNIYVLIRATDTEPEKIVRRMARRDNLDGDWVGIEFDSYHDHRTSFSFMVNAAGVKGDQAITEDGGNSDENWDPIWYVKTAADEEGWYAEMRIPFSQLRFASKDKMTWGLQVMRNLFRKEERSFWQFIPKDASGWVSRYGELQGLDSIKSRRRMEIVPYSVGKAQRFAAEEGNPFSTGKLNQFTGGIDGKIGITSDLTLDFTINPDFGQVEADPSEVNLTAFETYFHEKRPFFIEGRNILNFDIMGGDGTFSQDNLFYSRRIGRRPHRWPDLEDDEYMDMPENTSILGAVKITGKTRGGWSIGILDGLTAPETARLDFLGQRREEAVEPLTNYMVMRVQKDFRQGDTLLGGMFTATNRHINDASLNFLHKAAYTGGLDFSHSWKNKTYIFSVKTLFSHVRGSKEAILETQESPVHYFQRPDATHLSVDPERTSLSGHGGTVSFAKIGKGHLRYSGGVTWRSPGLELNDTGYLYTADVIMQWSWIGYRVWDSFFIFKRFNLNFNQWKGWDFAGDNIFAGGNINGYGQFKNYWGFNFGINRQGGSLSRSALRGGPAIKQPGGWNHWMSLHTDRRRPLNFSISNSEYRGDYNASNRKHYRVNANYRVGSALSVSLSPGYSTRDTVLQYVDTLELPDGKTRYLFGSLNQETMSLTVRVNYSITPELSIQFYGQPYISAGKYSNFKHISDPRAEMFRNRFHRYDGDTIAYSSPDELYSVDENLDGTADYSFENPDFNFLQFRSNLVLRWEYSPGSTVYLVWSQGRTDSYNDGEFNFRNDFRNLFRIKPHNVFLIKFTYRFKM
jgi:hypothetical protein